MPHTTLSSRDASGLPRTSAAARVLDAIIDPPAAFAAVRAQPTWGLAFLSLVLLRFGSALAFYNPETTPAKLASGVLFQLVTLFPLIAVTSTMLWLVALVWRARLTYAGAWCVTAHVTFAHALVTVALASVAGALLPESVDVALRHPPFTNLAFLADVTAQPFLHAVLGEIDVRSIYAVVLAGVGVRLAANTSRMTAAGVVASCFTIIAALAVASAQRQ
ncbi:MAG TPA: hypothetical protein VM076_04065 [Gemmatimonadaceae bacterium]|nr:hypothetical protein [Gemmatimonadaceae bacterium]